MLQSPSFAFPAPGIRARSPWPFPPGTGWEGSEALNGCHSLASVASRNCSCPKGVCGCHPGLLLLSQAPLSFRDPSIHYVPSPL